MARKTDALQTLQEDFLTCSICYKEYRDPCTIGCYHTFCRPCLTTFTKTRRDATTARSILCPTCAQMTTIPRPTSPVDHWSGQFKPSFLIQSLLDNFGEDAGNRKQPCSCEHVSKGSAVNSLCDNCKTLLCARCDKTQCYEHKMPLSMLQEPDANLDSTCVEHHSEFEFYCKGCKKSLCYKCCIVDHRQCESIVTLDSMLPQMTSTLHGHQKTLQCSIQVTEEQTKRLRSQEKVLELSKQEVKDMIRQTCVKARKMIDVEERRLLESLESLSQVENANTKSELSDRETDLNNHQMNLDRVNCSLHTGQAKCMAQIFEHCLNQTENESTVSATDMAIQGLQRRIEFVENVDDNISLGRLIVAHAPGPPRYVATLENIIPTRLPFDEYEPRLTGVTVVKVGAEERLVVTDASNRSVKSFCTSGNVFKNRSKLSLRHAPDGVCVMKENIVIVTIVYYEFVIVEVGLDHLTKKRKVSMTDHGDLQDCGSFITSLIFPVAMDSSKFVIASNEIHQCKYPPPPYYSVKSVDEFGNVLHDFTNELHEGPFIPWMTQNGDISVLSLSGSVWQLKPTGDVISKRKVYTPLVFPTGVTTTGNGDVLFADKGLDKVVQMTETGDYIRDVLTSEDVDDPADLHWYKNRLYVAQRCDKVKTFNMRPKCRFMQL